MCPLFGNSAAEMQISHVWLIYEARIYIYVTTYSYNPLNIGNVTIQLCLCKR